MTGRAWALSRPSFAAESRERMDSGAREWALSRPSFAAESRERMDSGARDWALAWGVFAAEFCGRVDGAAREWALAQGVFAAEFCERVDGEAREWALAQASIASQTRSHGVNSTADGDLMDSQEEGLRRNEGKSDDDLKRLGKRNLEELRNRAPAASKNDCGSEPSVPSISRSAPAAVVLYVKTSSLCDVLNSFLLEDWMQCLSSPPGFIDCCLLDV